MRHRLCVGCMFSVLPLLPRDRPQPELQSPILLGVIRWISVAQHIVFEISSQSCVPQLSSLKPLVSREERHPPRSAVEVYDWYFVCPSGRSFLCVHHGLYWRLSRRTISLAQISQPGHCFDTKVLFLRGLSPTNLSADRSAATLVNFCTSLIFACINSSF